MKQPTPLIGITDFKLPAEVERMLKKFLELRKPDSERKLHIGIMMNRKTLNDIPSDWADAYLPKNRLPHIFKKHPALFNVLHYADYKVIDCLENLRKATELATNIDCIQLDMILPDQETIKAYRRYHPDVKVILQINTRTFEMIGENPHRLIGVLEDYEDSLDYVLLDKSVGKGIPMDPNYLLPFAREIAQELPNLGLIVAGGLGPDTLHLAEPIIKEFPNVSIDAQSKLRPSGITMDPIDWNMAELYLERAVELMN